MMYKFFVVIMTTLLLIGCGGGTDSELPKAQDPVKQVDTTPELFTFLMAFSVPFGATVESQPITVAGINSPTEINVTDGEYSINGGAFSASTRTVINGDSVVVRNVAPELYLDKNAEGGLAHTRTLLNIGGVEAVFASFTFQASDTVDVIPDGFSVGPFSAVTPSSVILSSPITISGVETNVTIANTGGGISIDGGQFQNGLVNATEGQQVVFSFNAPSQYAAQSTELVSIGGTVMGVTIDTKEEPEPPTQNPNDILDALSITLNDVSPNRLTGGFPSSTVNAFPAVNSSPNNIITNQSAKERIDVVFSIDAPLNEIYISVKGATEHLSFKKPVAETTPTGTESISIEVEFSESLQDGDFCLILSAIDNVGLLSDHVDICVTIDADIESQGRTIFFADFSNDSTLSTLDFDNGEVVDIGKVGYELTDIAFFNNRLFGVTFTQLVEIDTVTGVGSVIGSIGYNEVNALEGGPEGLYAGTQKGELLSINIETGEGSFVAFFEGGAYTSGDLAFNTDKTLLYASVVVPSMDDDHLLAINPVTGENEIIGDMTVDKVFGLAFFRGQLLGLTDDGKFIIINTETGRATFVDNTGAFSAGGAATP
jgi:hypothetical protein